MAKIIYTLTDEAPLLATYSLLPIVEAFTSTAGVEVETRDISLAGRILAAFADRLPDDQRTADALAELGELAKTPEANIIKLPNISASVPQLNAAIAELQALGYDLPSYEDASAEDKARYDSVKGSAVNPVLREGNSDRRAPAAVKNYARKHPHSMGEWSADSKTQVATMGRDDFRSNEQSVIMPEADTLRIQLVDSAGEVSVLKGDLKVLEGEVVDATVLRAASLDAFLRENEESRGILNAGFTRDSAVVIRCVGDDHIPTPFRVWGAKALCGIGKIADTLADRSIPLRLRRKLPDLLRDLCRIYSLEISVKHLVELVQIALRLDKQRPAKDIKPVKTLTVKPLMQSLDKRHPVVKRHFESAASQKQQKSQKHYRSPPRRPPVLCFTVSRSSSFLIRKLKSGRSDLSLSVGIPESFSAPIQSSTSLVLGFFFSSKYSRT